MKQANLCPKDVRRYAEQFANDFLTTFTFKKNRDGLTISVAGCMELLPISDDTGYTRGIIHLQKEAIPVIDLGLKRGLHATRISDSACIVLVEYKQKGKEHRVGILVDDISDVFSIASQNLGHNITEEASSYGQPNDEINDCYSLTEALMNLDQNIPDIDYIRFEKSV